MGSIVREAIEASVPLRMEIVSSPRLDLCSPMGDRGPSFPPSLSVFGRVLLPGDSSGLGSL